MDTGIIKMDETEYWDESITAKTGKIWTYYVFNMNEVTHCCSLTGSYLLYPVHMETENQLNDDDHEEVFTAWGMDNLPDYYNCNLKPDQIETYFDDIEEAEEYYRCNAPYYELKVAA